ncbi:MAG: FtsQ-type POTRA domain-containing protein [Burkholderiales bacterium]|nr:FtsQ-type POTRA domain-containing protein [Burkholderiales bacterium]
MILQATAPTPALPGDVRLMQTTANAVFTLAALALCAAAVLWLTRLPVFALRGIKIEGDVARNSVSTIRANAAPKLSGNFFTLDLQKSRAAFEAVPWVRHAVVRRVWPNRLAVQLEEHRAAALWATEDGNDKLVNSHGEVFEANIGDVEDEALPRFAGPAGSAPQILALYRRLQPVLAQLNAGDVDELQLSGRGSWRAELEGGAVIELGRGTDDELIARTERFVRTLSQVTGHYQRPLESADLRHADGYAVRLKGITTTVPLTPARRK